MSRVAQRSAVVLTTAAASIGYAVLDADPADAYAFFDGNCHWNHTTITYWNDA
jgi:hypothetical protein